MKRLGVIGVWSAGIGIMAATLVGCSLSGGTRYAPDTRGGEPPARGYRAMAIAAAHERGVPAELFLRIVARESSWNPAALSKSNAVGLSQCLPATFRDLKARGRLIVPAEAPLTDPEVNLACGAAYLAWVIELMTKEDIELAARRGWTAWGLFGGGYYAGATRVRRLIRTPGELPEDVDDYAKAIGGSPYLAEK